MDEFKKKIEDILMDYEYQASNLLPILLDIQSASDGRYITDDTAMYIADHIKIPYAQISEVMAFFAAINKEKKGKYHIEMCNSTVCRVNDNHLIELFLEDMLGIKVGETTKDAQFSLDHAPCFGACDISPSFRINKKAYGHLTIDKVKRIIDQLKGELI